MKKIDDFTIRFDNKCEVNDVVEALKESMRNHPDDKTDDVKKLFAMLDNMLDIM